MWKNIVQTDRPQVTMWRIACWITKAKHTHTLTIHNSHYFPTTTIVT